MFCSDPELSTLEMFLPDQASGQSCLQGTIPCSVVFLRKKKATHREKKEKMSKAVSNVIKIIPNDIKLIPGSARVNLNLSRLQ